MPKTGLNIVDKSSHTMLHHLCSIYAALHLRILYTSSIWQFRVYKCKICVTLDLQKTARLDSSEETEFVFLQILLQ